MHSGTVCLFISCSKMSKTTVMTLLVLLLLALHTAAYSCALNKPYHQASSKRVLTCSRYRGNGEWYKNDMMINVTDSNKYSIVNYDGLGEKLKISNPSIDDEDSYSCYNNDDATDVYCKYDCKIFLYNIIMRSF